MTNKQKSVEKKLDVVTEKKPYQKNKVSYNSSGKLRRKENSKCRLCCDRDEMINYTIIECSKLAQKDYNTRHDWACKVIHGELNKKLKKKQKTMRKNRICTTQNISWRIRRRNRSGILRYRQLP